MTTKTKKRREHPRAKAKAEMRRKRGGESRIDDGASCAARETLPGDAYSDNAAANAGQAAGDLANDCEPAIASRKDKRRATLVSKPMEAMRDAAGECPSASETSDASQNNGHLSPASFDGQAAGEGDIYRVTDEGTADTCREIQELQRIRIAVLKSRQAIDNRLRATVATVIGYHAGLDPEARKAAHAKAQELIDSIGDESSLAADGLRVADRVSGIVKNTGIARAGFQDFLSNLESEMTKLAKSLPVSEWVKSVKGFGQLNLAIIVGECGDLSGYSNPAKVWRRMGCAPFNGKMGSTWKRKGGLSAEQWTEYGYCQRRRAIAFCLADCLIKTNDGEYRQRYDDVKAAKLALADEAWPKLRCHLHASLLTAKRAMRDLWKEWHKA